MKQFFHVARVVLEAKSPLMIASGEYDPNLDVVLARDVNGLPMVPATGIAGALRNLSDETRFGKAGKVEDTKASDVVFSDGVIHLSDDKPRDGILFEAPNDDLWQLYQKQNPVQRDHVKLDQYGVAEDTAKFQRGAVPKGSRFSFEISMMSETKDDPGFAAIPALLQHPLFGLGGARRSGYGAVKVVRCKGRCFDLKDAGSRDDYVDFRGLSFGENTGLPDFSMAIPAAHETISLSLTSEGFVMVGSNLNPIGTPSKTPDQSPYRENCVDWAGDTGILKNEVVIPGSAIKGPLRHRTEFHHRRMGLRGGEDAINTLFGAARDEMAKTGGAGKIRVADASPPRDYDCEANTRILPHVSIDRFSGGAYRSALFSTEALWKLPLIVIVTLEDGIDENARKALDLAIKDLKSGHLQIGADGGEGLGVFLADETGAEYESA